MTSQFSREEGRRLFGLDPVAYDAGRPGHPERVYNVLVERCGLHRGARVLEVGPGTGQATRRLLELGADAFVAVEPDPALAERVSAIAVGRVDVRVTPLEDVTLADGAFDLAVAASSFHWVDEDVGLAKIHGALRPGAWVALWWTLFGDEGNPDDFHRELEAALEKVYESASTRPARSPSAGRHGGPRFAFDLDARLGALARTGFERCEHELIRWSHTWDTAGIRALYASYSPIIRLDDDLRATVLDTVADVAQEQFDGLVQLTLQTSLFTARRPL